MAKKGLEQWVNTLARREMPVLSQVVTELNTLTGSDDAEVNQLAEVILKDANLTSQVLRIANSVHYNPASYSINTVSRAIVLIGFTGVKAICISVMVIDSLLGKAPRDKMLNAMAQAFHAAVQARGMMKKVNDNIKEEVFIAALLYHIGEMSFWAFGGAAADELEAAMQVPGADPKQAAEQVIGTTLKAITKELASIWKLGETLEEALYPPLKPSAKAYAVRLGNEISAVADKGWDSAEVGEVITKVSRFSGLNFIDARQLLMDNADEAAGVALTYGAAKVCHLIPTSHVPTSVNDLKKSPCKPLMQADPQLQLSVLRDLSNAAVDNLDVNAIFSMVIEGLHRGVGLERLCVAFVQGQALSAKYVLGEGTETWRQHFTFTIDPREDSIFSHAAEQLEPIWFDMQKNSSHRCFYSTDIVRLMGKVPAFVTPVRIGPRIVAMIYADRWNLGGVLSHEQFENFRHFIRQTESSLQLIAANRK